MENPCLLCNTHRPCCNRHPSQRKLTLGDFPMEHRVEDAQQRSLSCRQERLRLEERAQFSQQESSTQREDSRRCFETALEAQQGISPVSPSVSQHLTGRGTPSASRSQTIESKEMTRYLPPPLTFPNNGPSKDGSILYNPPSLLLGAGQVPPESELARRFDHLRGTCSRYPHIQRTLEMSNWQYRVDMRPFHKEKRQERKPPPSPHFVLLKPYTASFSDVTVDEGSPSRSTTGSRSTKSGGSKHASELDSGDRTGSKHYTSYCHVSASRESKTPEEKVQHLELTDKPTKQALPLTQLPGCTEVPASAITDRPSIPMTSKTSSSSSMSTVSYTQWPHCWVDEVTISSESLAEQDQDLLDELNEEGSLNNHDQTSKTRHAAVAQQLSAAASPSQVKKAAAHPLAPVQPASSSALRRRPSPGKSTQGGGLRSLSASGPVSESQLTSGEQDKELSEDEVIALPCFLCPSSESKSRKVATKEWLANTSFTGACTTVPLV